DSMVAHVERITTEMARAGFASQEPVPDPVAGERIYRFVKPGAVRADFSVEVRFAGTAVVTHDLNVKLTLEKPVWAPIRESVQESFEAGLTEAERSALRREFKSWLEREVNAVVAAANKAVVPLEEAERLKLAGARRERVIKEWRISFGGQEQSIAVQ